MTEQHSDVILTYRRDSYTVQPGMTVRRALIKIGLNPETVLAVREGTLITDDVILQAGDQIKLVATISGG